MQLQPPNDRPGKIGVITHGSLAGGVEMKLDGARSIEDVVAGTFVVIQGERYDFFSLITDARIDAANENILLNPPGVEEELLRRVMQGSATYATVSLKPMLMLENARSQELESERAEARPVKTIPTHFSLVAQATEDDVARVFGHETHGDGRTYFHVGEPIGMEEVPVCVDLDRFVERSNAVFGKTGTGKTFLTRLLLCGTIHTGRAVNLVFDMHSEYGLNSRQEAKGGEAKFVKGLRDLFPVASSSSRSTRSRRGRGGPRPTTPSTSTPTRSSPPTSSRSRTRSTSTRPPPKARTCSARSTAPTGSAASSTPRGRTSRPWPRTSGRTRARSGR